MRLIYCIGMVLLVGCAAPNQLPLVPVDGLQEVRFGAHRLLYYGDYEAPAAAKSIYPVWEPKVWKPVLEAPATWLLSTNGPPYIASAIVPSGFADTAALEEFLAGKVLNVVVEPVEQTGILGYLTYSIRSDQFPITTTVSEFLLEDYRVIFYSNESPDNMKREAWKVIGTLQSNASN